MCAIKRQYLWFYSMNLTHWPIMGTKVLLECKTGPVDCFFKTYCLHYPQNNSNMSDISAGNQCCQLGDFAARFGDF